MSRHSNISVFVPHIGCPHRCSFCNQRYITGQASAPRAADVDKAVGTALASPRFERSAAQIAFFGGSFTAVDADYRRELLAAARAYVDSGAVQSVRISTRPDCIDEEILRELAFYGVRSIELGAQSMCDSVLRQNERGHTADDVRRASQLIRERGFELGLQMMTGLYGSSREEDLYTARELITLAPDTVRIYPTVVLENTRLCELYRAGEYIPQTVEEAVSLGAQLTPMFEDAGIRIIRFGLHTIEEKKFVAGAWHPALAELAYSRIFLNNALRRLERLPKGDYLIRCGGHELSKMIGNGKCNLEKLRLSGYNCKVRADGGLSGYDIKIEREE